MYFRVRPQLRKTLKQSVNISSSLDLGAFSVQLSRLDSMEYLDLTIAKERRRTESSLYAVSGKKLGRESVLTAGFCSQETVA